MTPTPNPSGTPDSVLLTGLFGSLPGTATEPWQSVKRSGHLLALARREKGSLAEILRFYRALRPAGRAFRRAITLASSSPAWSLLPTQPHPTTGFIHEFEKATGRTVTGILFGNPNQTHRRAILRATRPGQPVWLVKAAFTPAATAAVRREITFLREASPAISNLPKITWEIDSPHVTAFATAEVHGTPMRDPARNLPATIRLLESLTRFEETPPLASSSEWPEIHQTLTKAPPEALNHLAHLPIARCHGHGDFAAWNLLVDPQSHAVRALDWEWGTPNAIAGLDLVHLFCQHAAMVEKLSDEPLIARTLKSLSAPAARDYLHACGWPAPQFALATYAACLNPIFHRPTTVTHLVSISAFQFFSLSAFTP